MTKFNSVNRKIPFKAVGGKAWLLPKIKPIWEKHQNLRWFDPFLGGGSLPLLLNPQKAFLSDRNFYLMCGYIWVKNFKGFSLDYHHSKEFYYQMRNDFNAFKDLANTSVDKVGEYFFRLNRSGFKGQWRVNKEGNYNIPWGWYKKFPTIDLDYWSRIFSNPEWKFHFVEGREALIAWSNDEDFLFLDPPYYNTFSDYTKEGYSWEDHVKLAELAADHDGPVILCNSVDKKIQELYNDLRFNVEIIDSGQKHNQSCQKKEIFATKNL
jgi:DNA adenine methylase